MDCAEVLALRPQHASGRVVAAHAAERYLELCQFDVAMVLFKGELGDDEEVQLRMPAPFG